MAPHDRRKLLLEQLGSELVQLKTEGHGNEACRAILKEKLQSMGFSHNTVRDYLQAVFI